MNLGCNSPDGDDAPQLDNDFPARCAILWPTCFEGRVAMFRAFTDHPGSVGETYLEHMGSASWFAMTMFIGAGACLLHAIFPFAFQKSGSRRIRLLHDRMVTHRRRAPAEPEGFVAYAEGI
jgi:hypothetical protein